MLEGDTIGVRENAMRMIVALASVLAVGYVLAVGKGFRDRRSRVGSGVIVVFSVVALFSLDREQIGWGTLLLVPLITIPTIAKAVARRSR